MKVNYKLMTLTILVIILIYIIFQKSLSKFSLDTDFDRYIINLKRNTERLNYISNLYSKSDLNSVPYIHFEAVDGTSLDLKGYVTEDVYNGIIKIDNDKKRVDASQLTRGMIGCYLSHLRIYEIIKKSDKPYALILEDDGILPNDILAKINDLLNSVPSDWDIILIGRWNQEEKPLEKCVKVERFYGTHCYVINRRGIEKMEKFGSYPINDQIDAVMSKLARDGVMNIYAPHKNIVPINTDLNTDVQMRIDP